MLELTTSETLRAVRPAVRGEGPARLLAAMALVLVACPAHAQGRPQVGGGPGALLTGEDFELQMQLPTGIGWVANPFRQGLANLASTHQIAVFLDRRVDPNQKVDFSSPPIPLWELCERLAGHVGAGAGRVGSVIYIGPPETARVLSTVIVQRQERIAQFPAADRRRLQQARPVQWPELSTPRDLIARVAADASLELAGSEQIPHDLWPAVDLPPMDVAEQLGLLLAGFGLTFEFTGVDSVQLVPLPDVATIERTYAFPAARSADLADLRRRLPGVEFSTARGSLQARATIEQHDVIRRRLSGTRIEGVEKRYSLEIQNQPIGPVAAGLAKKLGLEVQFDPRLADRLETLISFKVSDVTLDKLLDEMLIPADMSYQVGNGMLRIVPSGAP